MLGHPKYKHKDIVRFRFNDAILEGRILSVDSYGTTEQKEDVSYDILLPGMLYKHIIESDVIELVKEGNDCI